MKLSSFSPGSILQDANGQVFLITGQRAGNKIGVRRLWTTERYTPKHPNQVGETLWLPGGSKL